MTVIDDRTPNLGLALPHPENQLPDDNARLIEALNQLDVLVKQNSVSMTALMNRELSDVPDVTITALDDGHVLVSVGGEWQNKKLDAASVEYDGGTVAEKLAEVDGALVKTANLGDLGDPASARQNLGTETRTRLSPDTGRPQFWDPTQGAAGEWRNFGTGGLEPLEAIGTATAGQAGIAFTDAPPDGSQIFLWINGLFQTSAVYTLDSQTLVLSEAMAAGDRFAAFAYIPAENRPVSAGSVGAAEINPAEIPALRALLSVPDGLPVGMHVPWSMNDTPPSNWLICDGRTFSEVVHVALAALAKASPQWNPDRTTKQFWQWCPGELAGTIETPDYTADGGIFWRAMSAGRVVGDFQADQFQDHGHQVADSASVASGSGATRNYGGGGHFPYRDPADSYEYLSYAGGPNVRTGDETRPKNISFWPCVVASVGVVDDAARVNSQAVLDELARLGNVIRPYSARRNRVIDGNFDFWFEGEHHSTNGYGSATMWKVGAHTSTFTLRRQSFAPGQSDVAGSPDNFARITFTTGSAPDAYVHFSQAIEKVGTLAGKKATLTFWAKADSPKQICVNPYQIFGSGGPASSPVSVSQATVNITPEWAKYNVTIDFPSIAGKTVGTNLNDYITVYFWLDAGPIYDADTNSLGNQSGTFDIARISLVEGNATAETDPSGSYFIGDELAAVQRYYCQRSWGVRGYSAGPGSAREDMIYWPVVMRTAPTVSDFAPPTTSNVNQRGFWEPTQTGARAYIDSNHAGDMYAVSGTVQADARI